MCGLAGIVDPRAAPETLARLAKAMADALAHRGPDDEGVFVDPAAGFAVGHRRLSVVDLSPNGAQPMHSACGRYVMAYNGEVYNAAELRPELEARGIRFRGHSDTEVMLEGCAAWGVRATCERLIGMFVFALWDRQERRLWLVRDRLGIKPLYWLQRGPMLLFGSELKALRLHDGWSPELNRDALAAYLRHVYVPAPHTIYRDVRKLEAGTILSLDAQGLRSERFWELLPLAAKGTVERPDDIAATELDTLARDAVKRRMIADVPLGAFLSGGVDSSTVVALMQAQSNRPVKTFTIGFHEKAYDEAAHAAAVAKHLGTEHSELRVDPLAARDTIPLLPEMFDEPFADASQIPTYLVSRLTRQHVTVALSGDGGDELFAGYNRYFWATRLWRWLSPLPSWLRRAAACSIRAVPPSAWDGALRLVPNAPRLAGDKMHKLALLLDAGCEDAVYRRLLTHWSEPEAMVAGAQEPKGLLWDDGLKARHPDFMARMQLLDTLGYLPDDILTKVDRASMAVSLEGRVPLLDHRLVAFAASLPAHQRVRGGEGKWLLRRVLDRYVPRALIDRPKMGFAVPIDDWLRGPLKDWAESLLTRSGPIDMAPVRQAWAEHQSGRRNWQYHLWAVLMFQAWAARWL
jgi:asparagine synthase (glutamine-hydrolysing)